jgi:hypothetical protein
MYPIFSFSIHSTFKLTFESFKECGGHHEGCDNLAKDEYFFVCVVGGNVLFNFLVNKYFFGLY